MRSAALAQAIDAGPTDTLRLSSSARAAVIDLRGGDRRSFPPPRPRVTRHLESVLVSPPALPRRAHRVAVRVIDLVGSTAGLLLLVPLFLVVALLIRITSPGPVFFRQDRVGRRGDTFSCAKFRTMYVDAAERLDDLLDQPEFRSQWDRNRKLRDDPRITSIGRILRSFDLDELPQLWNVLKGEMSLVGPRPVLTDEAEKYGTKLSTVLTVKPGMTGLWQISGRNELTYEQRVQIDTCYVLTRSAVIDLALILRTFWLIALRRNGAQ